MDSATHRDDRRGEDSSAAHDASAAAIATPELTTLSLHLEDGSDLCASQPEKACSKSPENQLVQVRLGIATALFSALRCKDSDTATHALRVTLGCSAWALTLELDEPDRDAIEVAALLHDLGKVGVPDSILLKPGPLTVDEAAIMGRHRSLGVEILRTCCSKQEILDIVSYAPTWFDGTQFHDGLAGQEIPLGARMLSIVDAFDSMTSDKVYRRALSRERAFSELFRCAGTQFDPELVTQFSELHECDQSKLHQRVARDWLKALDTQRSNGHWQLSLDDSKPAATFPESLFRRQLVENMNDAVVFVDAALRIVFWNHGAERLTGIGGTSIQQRRWTPSLLDMRDPNGKPFSESDCPLIETIRSGQQRICRVTIRGRSGRAIFMEAHAVPVVDASGITHGSTLLMHDVSPELSLEARCQSLHELATKDPLTQVANRAEFNRVHEMFVVVHLEQQLPCSLIICDIDHFKQVNDTFGHQAGDEVLKAFAQLLKRSCRPGDLVSRYGGEEFVVLCTDCDNASAARRAEELRHAFSDMPHDALEGRRCTSSFGVTEIQPGDTPETMLRRADRALFCAKDKGRNMVVQLGTGIDPPDSMDVAAQGLRKAVEDLPQKSSLFGWLAPSGAVVERVILVTPVPRSLALEKLRGFVSDHHAKVLSIEGNNVTIRIGSEPTGLLRRQTDRGAAFLIDLKLDEKRTKPPANAKFATGGPVQTRVFVTIRPERVRDRRQADTVQLARQLVLSLRAYLMATESDEDDAAQNL